MPTPADRRLRVDDFDYDLPDSAIAQAPIHPRDASRLLVLDRGRSRPGIPALEHATFRQLGEWLRPGDLLVVNDSRVIPARLRGTRAGGGEAEVLLLRELAPLEWEALVRPSRRMRVGDLVTLASGDAIEIRGSAEREAACILPLRDRPDRRRRRLPACISRRICSPR